ncbi:hypothetical protein HPDP_00417 [Candidatus Hepatincola sp. Pdp]
MKTFDLHFTSFIYGEVASYVNIFSSKYYNSARKLENLLVSPYGPLVRRAGSKLVTLLEDNKTVNLQAFEDNNNMILMAFYGGESHGSISFYLNGKPLIQNGKPYSILTPYTTDEMVSNLCLTYDSDTKKHYIFNKRVAPKVLAFNEDYIFTLDDLDPKDGPYEDINKTDTTIHLDTLGEVGEEITAIASADLFHLLDCNKPLRLMHDSLWGYGIINGFISAKEVSVIVKSPFHSLVPTKDFRIGAWGDDKGYPSLGTVFNGRLYCASTVKDSSSLWISNTSEYDNFAPTTRASETLTDNHNEEYTVEVDITTYTNAFTGKVNDGKEVLWLKANKDCVLIGAKEGIFALMPLDTTEGLSPYNFQVKRLSSQKSSKHAISTDLVTCYADWFGYDLYSVEVLQKDVLFFNHINANAKHMFNSKIKDILLLDYPFNSLNVLLDNGNLLGSSFTVGKDSFNYAWYQYQLGNNAKIVSMATAYNAKQIYLWLHVAREFQGSTRYSIEVITFNNLPETYGSVSEANYVDCYMERTIENNTISALQEFEAETLTVISTDKTIDYGKHKVENGAIVLQDSVNLQPVIVGYAYSSIYESPVLDTNSTSTTTLGLAKKINSVGIKIPNTLNANLIVGKKILPINSSIHETDNFYHLLVNSLWQQNPTVKVEQSSPYTLTLEHIKVSVDVK